MTIWLRSGVVAVLALVTLAAAAAAVAEDISQDNGRAFSIRPALEAVVDQGLASGSEASGSSTLLAMPSPSGVALAISPGEADSGGSARTVPPSSWPVGGFDRTSRWLTGGLALGLGGYLALADTDDIRSLGDVTQLIPGVTALGFTIGARDWEGLRQLGLASGTAFVLTHGVKEIVDKTRPDDTADNSFPSGHTAASVTGAAFLWRRYGPKWGAPASVLALYTGISRVVGQNHFADDVVSGAAVGLISNWLWSDPIDERVQMALFATRGGAGVQVVVDPTVTPAPPVAWPETSVPRRFFLWELGGADVIRNDLELGEDPASIDFRFDSENNPTTTAFVSAAWISPRVNLGLFGGFAPFEVRESYLLDEDISFGGELIPAGTAVRSRYIGYDYRVGAGLVALRRPRVQVVVGGSLAVFDTSFRLETDRETLSAGEVVVRPLVSARLSAALGRRWLAWSSVNWWSDSDVGLTDLTAQVGFLLDPKWALSLGYRWVDRTVDAGELSNTMRRNQTALGVWYFW